MDQDKSDSMMIHWKAYLLIIFLIGAAVLLVDQAIMFHTREELQEATDNAALAGATVLYQGEEAVQKTAVNFLVQNPVWKEDPAHNPNIDVGDWDESSQSFVNNALSPTAVIVTASQKLHSIFNMFFDIDPYVLSTTSIASVIDSRPLNIMFIVDVSHPIHQGDFIQVPMLSEEEHLQVIKEAISKLFIGLRADIDEVGLIVLAHHPIVEQSLSFDITAILPLIEPQQNTMRYHKPATIADAIKASIPEFELNNAFKEKNIIILFSNATTDWGAESIQLPQLIRHHITVYDIVIGPENDSSFSQKITHDTHGARFNVPLNASDYTPEMQALSDMLMKQDPRLITPASSVIP